ARSESALRLQPADICVAAYGLALATVWLPLTPSSLIARVYVCWHLALLLIPLCLTCRAQGRADRFSWVRETYPLILVALFWPELGEHFQVAGRISHDGAIASLDQTIFGSQPSVSWSVIAPAQWIRQLMDIAYLAYYLVLIGIPVWIVRAGYREAVRELVLS